MSPSRSTPPAAREALYESVGRALAALLVADVRREPSVDALPPGAILNA